MKVLIFSDVYLPTIDGTVLSLVTLKKFLSKKGEEVKVIAPANFEEKGLISLKAVKYPKYPQYLIPILTPRDYSKIFREEADVVLSYTPMLLANVAYIYSKYRKIPMLSFFPTNIASKDLIKAYSIGIGEKVLWRYLRFIYRRSTIVIAPSPSSKSILNNKGIKNVRVIPPAVDLSRFLKSKHIKHKGIRIGFLGRLSVEKHVETLIRAAKYLNDYEILVAGDGPMKETYQREAKNYKNVRFLGKLNENEKIKFYASIDVFCNTSINETFGITNVEALSSGVPVVAANAMANRDIINEHCGELFRPLDPRDCAAKIKKAIANLEKYEPKEYGRKYDVKNVIDEYIKVFSEYGGKGDY